MRGDSGVAGEGRVVGVPKFHSWGKCTMPLTNVNSDWMFNASSGLCIILVNYLRCPLSCILGCNLGFDSSSLFVYTVMEPLTFLFVHFCSLRNNKISADGVLILAGALIVNKNLKLE